MASSVRGYPRTFPDGTIVWTDPDSNAITTHPGSRVLFPELCEPTAETVTRGSPPPKQEDAPAMPRRTTTRHHNRQRRIDDQRRHNIPLVAQRLKDCIAPY